jgi:nucleoside 2-deoxyribosyltransferase
MQWDRILDADEVYRRPLRALAFQEISHGLKLSPDSLFMVDLHLSFRWFAYMTKGFEPHVLLNFADDIRCFVNVVEESPKIRERLVKTSWGDREILELLISRDEELLLTDLFADACGPVECFAVSKAEPPSTLERLIWHPEFKKVYLAFPITNIREEKDLLNEVEDFRDKIREFLVVFDPYSVREYEETYNRAEMRALRRQVGETTVERDFRFIDQADALIAYFPKKVASKGVDAEMSHAFRSGKPIYLYCPEEIEGGPFAVSPSHFRSRREDFVELLRQELAPRRARKAK